MCCRCGGISAAELAAVTARLKRLGRNMRGMSELLDEFRCTAHVSQKVARFSPRALPTLRACRADMDALIEAVRRIRA